MKPKGKRIFISWYDGYQNINANKLFTLFQDNGLIIDHSTDSPHTGKNDKRWDKWYDIGLKEAIHNSEIFIAVITESYHGSTWMMQEYQEAYSQFKQNGKPKLYLVNFDNKGKNNISDYYVSNSMQLPSDPLQASRIIIEE